VAPRLCTLGRCRAVLLATLIISPELRGAESLQPFLGHLLHGKQGAVIVSNPNTGKILSIWNAKTAFEEAYPPGSTAKLVVSAAALEEGAITPPERIMCRRIPRLLGESYHCSHPAVDLPFDLGSALANSCNYFFSELSTRLPASTLAHWYALFGFGSTDPASKGTPPGQVRIVDEAKGKALAALGEQSVTATPAQVLLAYSAIATEGRIFRLIKPGQRLSPSVVRVVPLRKRTLVILADALRQCVQNGLCHGAAVQGVPVAGKTGTAAALDGSGATHAWFVGYAPADFPEVAIVVFLKRGTGSGDAAPLAGQILGSYFAHKSRLR
jgi:cell division protein FtsI/penicillin-binding protein 2